MTPDFETDRLVVGPWTAADADRVFDMYSRWEVARFLGSAPRALAERAEALALVDRWNSRSSADGSFGVWCAARRTDGVPVGTVLLVPVPAAADGAIEVGWHLHPDAWGHGYATEAARGALERGWAAGLMEIVAVVAPENQASLTVCRRLGMEHRGRTERYYGRELELFVAPRPAP
jgi:RimJ/RimL family protein N-acetyltransferase